MKKKECVLYDRDCVDCGECDMCDLDSKKRCDNCGACLESDDDYSTIDVDLNFEEKGSPELLSYEEVFPEKAFVGENAGDDKYDDLDFEDNLEDSFDDEYENDFDDSDNFYEDEYFDDYSVAPDAGESDNDQLRKDYGELF